MSASIPCIDHAALSAALCLRDLSDPAQGSHAVNLVVDRITAALAQTWGCGPSVLRPQPVVSVADNYDRLGYTHDAPARSPRYARYVGPGRLLRTHTTSAIPPWLDSVAVGGSLEEAVVVPGMVWRRDCVDRRHTGEPHQLDAWRVSRIQRLGRPQLLEMVDAVVGSVLPDTVWRASETQHPYTQGGLEVEALVGGHWLEILECGLAADHLLEGAGLPSGQWTGLAMGIGLDRMVMIAKGMDDIRLLRAQDPRIVRQMLDLQPWQPVSNQQASVRDLSVVHSPGLDGEMLGDMLRDALGADASLIEEACIAGRWQHDELPKAARTRLGLEPGQENLLVRLTVRSLDGPVSKQASAAIYARVYDALHRGTAPGYR